MRLRLLLFVLIALLAGCGKGRATSAVSSTPGPTTSSATTKPPTTTAVTTTAATSGPLKAVAHARFGTILVDSAGMSLYRFDGDSGGTIGCTAECAQTWPPAVVPPGTTPTGEGVSDLGTVTRPEGTTQVTYRGFPLYRYSGDAKAGDTNGDGVGDVWHIMTVESSSMSAGGGGSNTTAPPAATAATEPPATTEATSPPTSSATTAPPSTTGTTAPPSSSTASSSTAPRPCPYPPCY